ncbi:hypothetical protein COR50_19885 [Chitinophaga caeni]|uniref:Uncharacterized protein n=1 Tax=Chitinophaga caeni TaxID=2029983 RepID=A0A291QZB2_9BACT|nr:hypothetical protein COR50_19885 [Chitinophaga caeni]
MLGLDTSLCCQTAPIYAYISNIIREILSSFLKSLIIDYQLLVNISEIHDRFFEPVKSFSK